MLEELIVFHPFSTYIFLGIFSLVMGSLLNVIIYRLPLMLMAQWQTECCEVMNLPHRINEKPINLFLPRSFCPCCKKPIHAWQNIPVLSYLFMRGRCTQCKQRISIRYPLVELLSMGLALFAASLFGFTSTLIFALVFIWIVICLYFIDLEHQLLPDSLSLGLLWMGLIANTGIISGVPLFTPLSTAVLSAVGAYLSLWLFIKLFYLCTKKIGMGNGDFKLFAAFGAWFGWTQLPLILISSSLVGAVIGTIYLKVTKQSQTTPIPFGPFLCLSGLVSLFYGDNIVRWYLEWM